MNDPADNELRIAVCAAIEQWKNSRQLPHLSLNDCAILNRLVISGFQCLLFQRAKTFDKHRTEKA